MLSIDRLSSGQQEYYANLAREDYYLHGGEPPGIWHGQGARELGLRGQVDNDVFRRLFEGYHEDKPLVQNAGKENRCPGHDLTFSPPKSVSVAWSQADREIADEIRAAHLSAVEKALDYLEDTCAITRRGKGGAHHESAKLVFALFEHSTSRALDPQLHTHALMLNVGLREDGTFGALETHEFYRHKFSAGALYRAELAYQLEKRLGMECLREKFAFEIMGVPEALIDRFSTRRKEILEALALLDADGAIASEKVALMSRTAKKEESRENLDAKWKQVGESLGWTTKQLRALIHWGPNPRPEKELEVRKTLAASRALQAVTKDQSSFTQREFVRFVAEECQGMGLGAEEALQTAKHHLQHDPEIQSLGVVDGDIRYSTQEILQLEADMMERVGELSRKPFLKLDDRLLAKVAERHTLNEGQAKALRHITQETGKIAVVTGDAGTGKTHLLGAVREAYESMGYQLYGTALAARVASDLEAGADIKSSSVTRLIHTIDHLNKPFDAKEARQAYEAWRRSQWNPNIPGFDRKRAKRRHEAYRLRNPSPLNENTVLVIDEAAMVDTRQLARLLEQAQAAGSKVVMVGDSKQLQAIGWGGGFAAIGQAVGGGARLKDIVRQKDAGLKKAIREVADGSVPEALRYFAEKGAVTITESRTEAKQALIEAWVFRGEMLRVNGYR